MGKVDIGGPFVSREADVFEVGITEDSQSAFMLHRDAAGRTTRGIISPSQYVVSLQLDKKDGQLFGLSMLDQQGYIQKISDNGQITSTLFKFPTGWYAYGKNIKKHGN